MQFAPTNFFEMRIGSQLSSLDRNVRSVVPSASGKRPALNSWIRRFAKDSSSGVHLPRRSPFEDFFLLNCWAAGGVLETVGGGMAGGAAGAMPEPLAGGDCIGIELNAGIGAMGGCSGGGGSAEFMRGEDCTDIRRR